MIPTIEQELYIGRAKSRGVVGRVKMNRWVSEYIYRHINRGWDTKRIWLREGRLNHLVDAMWKWRSPRDAMWDRKASTRRAHIRWARGGQLFENLEE